MTVTDHFRIIDVCFPDKNCFDVIVVVVVVVVVVVYAYTVKKKLSICLV